jgi:hypothetical protein
MAKVRGRTIIPVRAFLKENFGDVGWRRVLAELPGTQRAVLDGLMLQDSWYDRAMHSALLEVALRVLGGADPTLLGRRIGARIARHHDKLYLRPLLKLGGPRIVVRRAAALYRDYYQGGEMSVVEEREAGGVLRIDDPSAPRLFCDATLPGFAEELIRLAGQEPVFVRQIACRFAGAAFCELDIEWR